jgi:gamma-glutamyltranspeptidase/glutathione hydrolase
MKGVGTVLLESRTKPDVLDALIKMGHTVKYKLGGFGGYQAIMVDWKNRIYVGASESRKDGQAAGY